MTDTFQQTAEYIARLTGDVNTPMDWRVIHDTNKGEPAHTYRGTVTELYHTLQGYNQAGWGVFVCINAMDGQGRDLANVAYVRAHVVDLDDVFTSRAAYERAVNSNPQPHFAVNTSPDKYHIYWLSEHYTGNDYYSGIQRKLAQTYDGDRKIIDASRVLRVPGFLHQKDPQNPYMVSSWPLFERPRYSIDEMAHHLQHINIVNYVSIRSPLGEKELEAPSLDWLNFAMGLLNPNEMERGEWLSVSAAFKQSGWNHATEEELYRIWVEWCNQYDENDEPENLKLWNSIKDSEVGWGSFERKTPVNAYMKFGSNPSRMGSQTPVDPSHPVQKTPLPPPIDRSPVAEQSTDSFGELLSAEHCKVWFKNCTFIERTGEIFSPSGRFMNSTKFNGKFGGKQFIITGNGKCTDDPWKAALRSTMWTVPKADHVRFLPNEEPFTMIEDKLGRKGLNTYIPIKTTGVEGDVSLFLDHVNRILPNPEDQKIWLDYLAHCVKYPGHKIPWAPLLQSAEGVGKSVFFEVMQHALGDMYVYRPKAPELVSSGSKFNAWMRSKLLIVVDEIKIDERRELIEILKPMITDSRVEVQAKGVDQEMEDNLANWIFFSNYKDAIPINKNGRRYAIFFSVLQSAADILEAGMNDAYFNRLWGWLEDGGLENVTYWLKNYPIEKGSIPVRAPQTSSHAEALRISRSPMEVVIADCVEDGATGFRGGYVSVIAVGNKCKAAGMRQPSRAAIVTMLQNLGYVELGRAVQCFAQEDPTNKSVIFGISSSMDVAGYGPAQGYTM